MRPDRRREGPVRTPPLPRRHHRRRHRGDGDAAVPLQREPAAAAPAGPLHRLLWRGPSLTGRCRDGAPGVPVARGRRTGPDQRPPDAGVPHVRGPGADPAAPPDGPGVRPVGAQPRRCRAAARGDRRAPSARPHRPCLAGDPPAAGGHEPGSAATPRSSRTAAPRVRGAARAPSLATGCAAPARRPAGPRVRARRCARTALHRLAAVRADRGPAPGGAGDPRRSRPAPPDAPAGAGRRGRRQDGGRGPRRGAGGREPAPGRVDGAHGAARGAALRELSRLARTARDHGGVALGPPREPRARPGRRRHRGWTRGSRGGYACAVPVPGDLCEPRAGRRRRAAPVRGGAAACAARQGGSAAGCGPTSSS